MSDGLGNKRDFFVSFNRADRAWATWVAWVLEEAGYSVWFQDWDFRGNFVEHMNRAQRQADRTIAVLSDHYFGSDFTLAEWSSRFAQDPAMREDRLVPVKVGPLSDSGLLAAIVYADLTDADESQAHRRLLERVKKALDESYRPKPLTRPGFPGSPTREILSKPLFPKAETKPSDQRKSSMWSFVPKRKNGTAIGWVGAGLAVVIVVLWTGFVYFSPPNKSPASSSNVEANCGSIAVGGDVRGTTIMAGNKGDCPEQQRGPKRR